MTAGCGILRSPATTTTTSTSPLHRSTTATLTMSSPMMRRSSFTTADRSVELRLDLFVAPWPVFHVANMCVTWPVAAVVCLLPSGDRRRPRLVDIERPGLGVHDDVRQCCP